MLKSFFLLIECQGPRILLLHLFYGGVPYRKPEGPLQGEPEQEKSKKREKGKGIDKNRI